MLIVLLRDRNASIYSECVLILFRTVFLSPIPQKKHWWKDPRRIHGVLGVQSTKPSLTHVNNEA